MPLLKTKALPVSDVPNCESWVSRVSSIPNTNAIPSEQYWTWRQRGPERSTWEHVCCGTIPAPCWESGARSDLARARSGAQSNQPGFSPPPPAPAP